MADAPPSNPQDLTLFVQNLLETMQTRFESMSNQIVARIDEMGAAAARRRWGRRDAARAPRGAPRAGNRIDDLEKSIAELTEQAGVEPPEEPAKA